MSECFEREVIGSMEQVCKRQKSLRTGQSHFREAKPWYSLGNDIQCQRRIFLPKIFSPYSLRNDEKFQEEIRYFSIHKERKELEVLRGIIFSGNAQSLRSFSRLSC